MNNILRILVLPLLLQDGVSCFSQDTIRHMVQPAAKKDCKTRYYRHEINVGMGSMSYPDKQWADYEEGISRSFHLGRYGSWPFGNRVSGGLHLSYFYHLNHYWAFGGLLAVTSERLGYDTIDEEVVREEYERKWIYREEKDAGNTRIKWKSFFLLPTVKCNFVNNSWCSLYSKVALGLHHQRMRLASDMFPEEILQDTKEHKTWFAYIVTPLGWEIERKKVRCFVELGVGSNTNFQMGLSYRFGRYEY